MNAKQYKQARKRSLAQSKKELAPLLANLDGLRRLWAIPAADFIEKKSPIDWQNQVYQMTDVQKLVHLAMRFDGVDQDQLRSQLVKTRQRVYQDELGLQAARASCSGRQGRLTTGQSLSDISRESELDAESIISTYNYDLGRAIQKIAEDNPSANRNTYAKGLKEWHTQRDKWKVNQIAQHTEATARSRAMGDFYKHNDIEVMARVEPRTARGKSCDCAYWIGVGDVPFELTQSAPMPQHPNCPHYWVTYPKQVKQGDCAELWLGE